MPRACHYEQGKEFRHFCNKILRVELSLQKFTHFTGKIDTDFTFATQTLRIFTKESEKELNGFVHTVN